ncbi:hypothetical protein EDC01DRAFT_632551 [Geopyxis carbonaria]|nr:hypothetical protein EDC01DRAFT_632551 [Geopyxis carbonaria]
MFCNDWCANMMPSQIRLPQQWELSARPIEGIVAEYRQHGFIPSQTLLPQRDETTARPTEEIVAENRQHGFIPSQVERRGIWKVERRGIWLRDGTLVRPIQRVSARHRYPEIQQNSEHVSEQVGIIENTESTEDSADDLVNRSTENGYHDAKSATPPPRVTNGEETMPRDVNVHQAPESNPQDDPVNQSTENDYRNEQSSSPHSHSVTHDEETIQENVEAYEEPESSQEDTNVKDVPTFQDRDENGETMQTHIETKSKEDLHVQRPVVQYSCRPPIPPRIASRGLRRGTYSSVLSSAPPSRAMVFSASVMPRHSEPVSITQLNSESIDEPNGKINTPKNLGYIGDSIPNSARTGQSRITY